MPRKRTHAKLRRQLGDQEMQDLFYGPGTCLFDGEGYLGPHGGGHWRDRSDALKNAVLEAMRADWKRHSGKVMQAWANRDAHERDYIAVQYYGNPSMPWAAEQFGFPRAD